METDESINPPADPPADPPRGCSCNHDELAATVGGLSDRLASVETVVTDLTSGGTTERDSTPVKKPWTHWGSGR